jgi:hypothetical protein
MTHPPGRQTRPELVVWGLMASSPFGGMVWQVLHHLEGFRRLGYDVWYVEDSDRPALAPRSLEWTDDVRGNLAWLDRWMHWADMGDRWVYRTPGAEMVQGATDGHGLQELYRRAAAVVNLCGAQELTPRHDEIRCLIYLETDPVPSQVALSDGDERWRRYLDRHHALFTYGTNLGSALCPIPTAGYDWRPTVPPVVVDWWSSDAASRDSRFTTVLQWSNKGKDVEWNGEVLRWSKDGEFARYLPVARSTEAKLAVALRTRDDAVRDQLVQAGWLVSDARDLDDPLDYRAFIQGSRGEFSVAKHQYVASVSGWISDRTVCYLAAGRPAVVQRTGIRGVPVGSGLVDFGSPQEAIDALRSVQSSYPAHSRDAADLARAYFDAETVLDHVLEAAGVDR